MISDYIKHYNRSLKKLINVKKKKSRAVVLNLSETYSNERKRYYLALPFPISFSRFLQFSIRKTYFTTHTKNIHKCSLGIPSLVSAFNGSFQKGGISLRKTPLYFRIVLQ